MALTAAAVATESLVVGTGVALIPQRDPIITAKEVASLDASRPDGSFSAWGWAGTAKKSPTTASIPRCVDAWPMSGWMR